MAYLLRFTQEYRPADREQFLALEGKFAALEKGTLKFPPVRRLQPVTGREATHSLIWECEFSTLAGVEKAMAQLAGDPTHTELFRQQSPYITAIHADIFEILEF